MAKHKKALCEILKAGRQASGLSLQSIAKKIKFSVSNLSRLEKGVTRSIPASKLALFAEAYRLDIEILRPYAKSRTEYQADDYSCRNVLPLLKAIIASDLEAISVCELQTLLNAQRAVRFALSPATIKSILADLRGYTE